MARRRVPPPPRAPRGERAFTPEEIERIRHLIATSGQVHPDPNVDELHRLHKAAGRRRGFMVWEIDRDGDLEEALREELSGGLA